MPEFFRFKMEIGQVKRNGGGSSSLVAGVLFQGHSSGAFLESLLVTRSLTHYTCGRLAWRGLESSLLCTFAAFLANQSYVLKICVAGLIAS